MIGELAFKFIADTKQAKKELADLERQIDAIQKKLASVRGGAGGGRSGSGTGSGGGTGSPGSGGGTAFNDRRAFSDQRARINALRTDARATEQELNRIRRTLASTFDPASESAQRLSQRANRLGQVLQGSQAEARRLQSQLAQAFSSRTLTPQQIQAIQARLDQLNQRIARTQGRLQDLGRDVSRGPGPVPPPPNPSPIVDLGTAALNRLGIAGVAAGNLVAQGLMKVIEMAWRAVAALVELPMEFEYAMRKIQTMLGDTEESIGALARKILNLSTVIPRSGVDLASGMYEVLQAGFEDAGEAMEIMEVSARAAVGGFTDTKVAADGITTVLNAYRMEAKEAARVSDVLFETVKWGKVSFEQMAQGMGMTVTTAALAGLEFEELGAAIATMTAYGIRPREAFTAMNNLLLSLSSATDEQRQAAKDMGIEWSVSGMRAMGFAKWIQNVNEKTAGNIDLLKEINPNIRAARAAFIVAGNGADEYQEILDKLKTNTGAATNAFDTMTGSGKESWQLFKNQVSKSFIELGSVALPGLVDELNHGSDAFEHLSMWAVENQEEIKEFAADTSATIRVVAELISLTAKPIVWTVKIVSDFSGFVAGGLDNAKEGLWQGLESDMETNYRQMRSLSRREMEALGQELKAERAALENERGMLRTIGRDLDAAGKERERQLRAQITAYNARWGEITKDDPVVPRLPKETADRQRAEAEAAKRKTAAEQAAAEEEAKRRKAAAAAAREAREEAEREAKREAKRREAERKRAQEKLREMAAERRQLQATIQEATGRPLTRLEDITGKVREAVAAVWKLDQEIMEVQKQISEAGGAALAPAEILRQLEQMKADRARLLGHAQAVSAKADNWQTAEVAKATDALKEYNQELGELALFRLKAWEDAPAQLTAAINRWKEMGQEIREIEELLEPLALDQSEGAAQARAQWQPILDRMKADRDAQLTLIRSLEGFGPLTRGMQEFANSLFGDTKLTAGQIQAATPAFQRYARAMGEAARAQEALHQAKKTVDPRDDVRAILAEAKATDQAKDALDDLEQSLRASGVEGEQLADVLAKIRESMGGLKGGKLDLFGKAADSFTKVVDAVRELGDALGGMDEKSEAALDGLMEAGKAVQAFAQKDYVGMVVHGVKAAINFHKFFTAGPSENELARMRIERNLIKAMKDLEKAVLNAYSTNQVKEQRALVEKAVESLDNNKDTQAGGGWGRGDQTERRDALEKAAKDMGLVSRNASEAEALAALREWLVELEAMTGQTGLVEAFDNDWLSATILDILKQVNPALLQEQGEIGGFSNDVAGTIEKARYNLELIGKSDAAEVIQEVTEALLTSGHDLGDLADYLHQLNGLDLSTAEGRAERDAIVQTIMKQLEAGNLDLGDMTGDQFQQLVMEWATAKPDEKGSGSTGSLHQVNTITDVQANRLLGYQSSILHRLTQIRDTLMGRTPVLDPEPYSGDASQSVPITQAVHQPIDTRLASSVTVDPMGPLTVDGTDLDFSDLWERILDRRGLVPDVLKQLEGSLTTLSGPPVRLPTDILTPSDIRPAAPTAIDVGGIQLHVHTKATVSTPQEADALSERIGEATLQKVERALRERAERKGKRGKITLEVEV